MNDRHALNSYLKEAGFGTSGDLVFLDPARSATMEIRRAEKAVVATISTAARDRHGDVIDPKGVRLERFRKNPVVLYAHDYEGLPVARSLWERVRDGDSGPELVAKPQFHMDTELSREVWALVEKGVLSAWSVGFIPEEWQQLPPQRAQRAQSEPERRNAAPSVSSVSSVADVRGFKVLKWDLLEYSCVPVAANYEALTRELEERRITAPALVKSLAPLGMRAPDLVAQPVATDRRPAATEGTEDTEEGSSHDERTPGRAVHKGPPFSACPVTSVADAVARGFDRWLRRARGEGDL